MKKILVPVDFSDNTDSVCQYALQIARKSPSEIILFHAFFDQVIITDGGFPTGIDTESMINEQLLQDIKSRAKADILELQKNISDQIKDEGIKNIKIIYTLEGGEPENEIIGFAKTYQPDLIVMGASGSGKKDFLQGSVSKKVMNNINIPVFSVPKLEQISPIKEIMYITEFINDDVAALKKIFELLKPFDIRIYCLHILIGKKIDEVESLMKKVMDQFANEERNGVIQFTLKKETDIQEDINNFIKANNINLISFIPHKRSLFHILFKHTITKKDLLQFNMPLLAIHV
jgi:nucleotide-binding universal stress UspA family protein/vacuolar-type H+-ATPase subunit F/Vma7